MTRTFRRLEKTRAKLLIMMSVLVLASLVIAACGGTPTSAEPSDATLPSNGATVQPGESDQGLEPSVPGGADALLFPEVGSGGKGPTIGESPGTAQLSSSTVAPAVQYTANQQAGIWVTGRGEVTTTPDLAVLNAGVESKARTVAEARIQAAQAMDQIVQMLKERGIQDRDIQTRVFQISPEYTYNDAIRKQELVGYRVNNQISVKIRDIGGVGVIVDEVAAAGGDLVRIQGINFTVEDTEALEFQARERAVQALLAKAGQFAQLTDVELGKLVFLSESGGFTPRVENLDARFFAESAPAALATTPISGGELKVTVTVQAVFSIL